MFNIGMISYSVAALAFLALSLVMLTGWRGRLQGALLTSAAVITVAWAVAAAYNASSGYPPTLLVPLAEIVRDAAWLVFLLRLLASSFTPRALRANWKAGSAVVVVAAVWFGLLAVTVYPGLFASARSLALGLDAEILGRLVLAIVGLVLVEQLYRNTLPERRWAIKFLCIGVGGIFAYDFFLYSDAMLFKRVNAHWWAARGFIDAMVVPLIAVAAARNPEWSLDVYVSRSIVFHTTTLLAAGIYLLAMAAGGYYIRLYGGDWGQVLQAIFFFSALLVLLSILFSGQVRAHLRVFLSKHFFNYKYDYREEWLRFIKTLSTEEQTSRLRELTIRAVAQIVESPGGLLWFRDDGGHYGNTAHWNLPPQVGNIVRSDSPLVTFLGQREWVIDIDDYQRSPERYPGLRLPDMLTRLPHAWLIVPLMQHERLMGFMVLARARVPRDIDWEDCDLLKTVGRQVASYLGQLQASEALFDARQFEAFNRFSAYVVHDLKNLVAQLSLVVSNAARHKHNPQFMEDAVRTVDHSVQKMNHLLGQLRGGRDARLKGADKTISVTQVMREVVAAMRTREPAPSLTCEDDDIRVRTDPQRLGTVAGHVIQNAQEATPADGEVRVRLYRNEQYAVIEVSDTGCGMDAQFMRDHLFRPFDSTKGKSGMGIGVYETREWVREQGGDVEVQSQPGKGTVFRIRLPRVDESIPSSPPAPDEAKTTV